MSVLCASKLPLLSSVSAKELYFDREGRKVGRVKKVGEDTNNNSRLLLHMNKLNLNYQAIPRYSKAGITLPSNADMLHF